MRVGTRLTLWGSIITLSVCTIVCVVLYAALNMLLNREVDSFLEGEVQEFLAILETESHLSLDVVQEDIRRELGSRPRGDLTFRLLDLQGGSLLSSDPHDPLEGLWKLADSQAPEDRTHWYDTITLAKPARSIRICSQRNTLASAGECVVQATYALDGVYASLATFRMFCFGALGFAVGLSVIGGRILARKSLKPVYAMTTEARRIGVEDLARRLDRNRNGDELDHLAEVLNEMLDRIQMMFQRIQRFTADAAHELRTPLAALRGNAEVALGHNRTESELRKVLEDAIDTYDRMSRIAEDLLLLARADAGQSFLRPERFVLNDAIQDVVDLFAPLAQEKGVSIDCELRAPNEITADSARVRQILSNLLDNAIKFTPEGGGVRVSAASDGSRVRMTISDSGAGIDPEHLPHVFDRFFRADAARSRDVGGSGLGLSICQTIARAHGGSIDIISAPNEGTAVTVSLPLTSPSADHPVESMKRPLRPPDAHRQ